MAYIFEQSSFPLGGLKHDFTNVKEYLGWFIADDLCDGHDMKRETRCVI